jgi:hypothetical protein
VVDWPLSGAISSLLVRTDESLPAIHADRGQIDQILVNLAVNARDAMPDGGTLTIETRGVDHDPLEPGTPPGRHVQLSVSDTGLGMSAEVVAHAFEPFFTTKPKGQGTGLGLATVYGIVTRSGGTVTVHSEDGLGTTFRIRLPSAGRHAAPVPDEAAAPPPKGHGETILVVEDEPALLATTTRTLRQNGYHVLSAASGEAALVLAAHNDVHLLLSDLVMPKMSGSALTEMLTALHPHLAVLFMSGYSEDVLDRQRLHHGDIALVQKPFTRQGLLRMVDAALAARTIQDTARS